LSSSYGSLFDVTSNGKLFVTDSKRIVLSILLKGSQILEEVIWCAEHGDQIYFRSKSSDLKNDLQKLWNNIFLRFWVNHKIEYSELRNQSKFYIDSILLSEGFETASFRGYTEKVSF
jgi:hypothetical protein